MDSTIQMVYAREILDSRGNPTVEVEVGLADGSFGFLPFMGLSLTYDHRAIDGGPATLFLAEIKKQIEQINSGLLEQD